MKKRYYEWAMKQCSRWSYRFYSVYDSSRINWKLFWPRVRNEFLMVSIGFSRIMRRMESNLLMLKIGEKVERDLATKSAAKTQGGE